MTLAIERTKQDITLEDSCLASEDLTEFHHCMVTAGGGASGNMTVGAPGGQGVLVYGNVLNTPNDADDGETVELQVGGIGEVKANGTIDAGVELTVGGVDGRAEAAASGDFVFGISREAATGANHLISYTTKCYYKP